jgi:hypothetical protein
VQDWCRARDLSLGGLLSLDTAWRLAQAWYHDRLEPSWTRKSVQEAQGLFTELGMTEPFWNLSG